MKKSLFAISLLLSLSACAWLSPYQMPVQQGNVIESAQIAQLKEGLTRAQVKYILGTPLLQDPFHVNRWDYIYFNKVAGKNPQQAQFSVYFNDDKLIKWEGSDVHGQTPTPAP